MMNARSSEVAGECVRDRHSVVRPRGERIRSARGVALEEGSESHSGPHIGGRRRADAVQIRDGCSLGDRARPHHSRMIGGHGARWRRRDSWAVVGSSWLRGRANRLRE